MAHGRGGEAWLSAELWAHGSAPGWELSPVPGAEKSSPRRCQQPGGSQSSARNYWQDTPELAQDHKSSSSGATNRPAAPQGQEGTFPGERKGYLRLALPLPLPSELPQDAGAAQTSRPAPGSEFLRFRWGGREVNREISPSAAPSRTCRARSAQPARGRCLCSGQNPANKGGERHGQHNAGLRWGRPGSPEAAQGLLQARGSGQARSAPPEPSKPSPLGAKSQLESLHASRGSCAQGRFVYCVPGRGASPVLGAELARCASVSPQSALTIPSEQLSCSIDPGSLWNSLADP